MLNNYRYLITDLWKSGSSNNPIIGELPFTGVNFTSELNNIGTFQGHLLLSGVNASDLNVSDATIPGKTALYVDYNGTIVWGGVIWNRQYDSDSQTLSITAQEFESYFQRRRISNTKNYVNADPLFICQDLIDYAQNKSHGNIGVVIGAESSALQINKLYNSYEVKSVYQAIKDLAQGSLFDFKIVPSWNGNYLTKTLVLGSPTIGTVYDSTDPEALVLELPGNLVAYSYTEDGITAANKLYGLGYGSTSYKTISAVQDDAYVGSGGTWPLLEDTVNYIDVNDSNLLTDLTAGKLYAISYPPTIINAVIPSYITPKLGTYSVGDEMRVVINDNRFPTGLNATYRITAISVSPGENGPDRVTITLTLPYVP